MKAFPAKKKTNLVVAVVLSCFVCSCLAYAFDRASLALENAGLLPTRTPRPPATATVDFLAAAVRAQDVTSAPTTPASAPVKSQPIVLDFTPTTELLFTPTASLLSNPLACLPPQTPQTGTVVDIISGDTIKVLLNDATYSVRYIGIQAPQKDEYFSPVAKQRNFDLVYAKQVSLYKDTLEKDDSGRLLRYVVIGDTFVNLTLLQEGYARATDDSTLACTQVFKQAENKAFGELIGLWGTPPTAIVGSGGTGGGGSGGGTQACCKYCTNSQPCGDSCIALNRTCHQPPGCACK